MAVIWSFLNKHRIKKGLRNDYYSINGKRIRESTGAGMMDAKKALTETSGDFEAAVDWLRTGTPKQPKNQVE